MVKSVNNPPRAGWIILCFTNMLVELIELIELIELVEPPFVSLLLIHLILGRSGRNKEKYKDVPHCWPGWQQPFHWVYTLYTLYTVLGRHWLCDGRMGNCCTNNLKRRRLALLPLPFLKTPVSSLNLPVKCKSMKRIRMCTDTMYKDITRNHN